MSRVLGFVVLLALCAATAGAEEDRSAYSLNQKKLTEQLNAQIAKGIAIGVPAPPAQQAPEVESQSLAKANGARS
jgi:hypothetical protein